MIVADVSVKIISSTVFLCHPLYFTVFNAQVLSGPATNGKRSSCKLVVNTRPTMWKHNVIHKTEVLYTTQTQITANHNEI